MISTTDLDGGDGVGSLEENVGEKGDVESGGFGRAEEERPWPLVRRKNERYDWMRWEDGCWPKRLWREEEDMVVIREICLREQ